MIGYRVTVMIRDIRNSYYMIRIFYVLYFITKGHFFSSFFSQYSGDMKKNFPIIWMDVFCCIVYNKRNDIPDFRKGG